MQKKYLLLALEFVLAAIVLYFAGIVNEANSRSSGTYWDNDINYEYISAIEIERGVNPYSKILSGDLLVNKKFATLLPNYYMLIFGVAKYSHFQFPRFVENYRMVLYSFEFVGALFLYLLFRRKNMKLVGLLASTFFIFNRWTLNLLSDLKPDTIAIAFLIASLYFLDSKRKLSFVLLGFSLSIKHLAVFMLPMYFLPILEGKKMIKPMIQNSVLMILPIITLGSIFIFDNFKAFVFSMLFSATREPKTSSIPFGYEKLLIEYYNDPSKNKVAYYLLPRLPLLISNTLLVIALFLKKIPRSLYPLISMFFFVSFNPVLFDQYITWLIPFVFYSCYDLLAVKGHGKV